MRQSMYLIAGLIFFTILGCKGQTGKSDNDSDSKSTIHITKADFLNLIMDYEKNTEVWKYKGEKPCLIDFYADWCAPCRISSPIIEDLAKKYSGKIIVYKVNIDQEKELAALFGIQSIPAFLFCPVVGNPTISSGIANSPEATRNMFIQQIEKLLLKTSNPQSI
jgi:thioredoxin 1